MRVLLAQNMPYLPSLGGATRSGRLLMERLAATGHECRAVTTPPTGGADVPAVVRAAGGEVLDAAPGRVRYRYAGVDVEVVAGARLARTVQAAVKDWPADRVLVPGDDPGHMVLAASMAVATDRVVHLTHTIQRLPFGPDAFHPSPSGHALMRDVPLRVAIGPEAVRYLDRYGSLKSVLLEPHVYGNGPWPDLGYARGPVTMVNPCGYKGVAVLLGAADARPGTPFRAVVSWGTTSADLHALRLRRNIEVVPASDDITDVLAGSRALLAPSLWRETFGYTLVEAMLRGVPVLASDHGGLRDSGLGVARLHPVHPVTGYDTSDLLHPQPVVPEQDLQPWLHSLDLLDDAAEHERSSREARRAAQHFVAGLDPDALAGLLVSGALPSPASAPVS